MKKIFTTLLLLFGIFSATTGWAHQAFSVSRGLKALAQGDLEAAATELNKAWFADPDNPVISYNLGIVEYRRRNFVTAAQKFAMASSTAEGNDLRFASLYNLGNSAFKSGDYAAAVAAYSAAIDLKKNYMAEYNLKVAQEKLKKQQEQQKQNDQQNQQKQDESKKQQNQDGQQEQKDQSGQQNQQDNQNQQGQSGKSDQQKNDGSNNSDSQGETESEGQEPKKDSEENTEKKDDQTGSKRDENAQDKADSQKGAEPATDDQATASQTQQLAGQTDSSDEQRQDVEMKNNKTGESAAPEASQRAKAMKNIKVNPYMIEKVLKEMERREHEAQLRARNEGARNEDELDPFSMDADQLRDWFDQRGRPKRQTTDEPDW